MVFDQIDGRLSKPVIVVTGANSGIGFGICHRLIRQLAHPHPQDAAPFVFDSEDQQKRLLLANNSATGAGAGDSDIPPCLTIIMACRSTKRAEVARLELLHILEADIENLRARKQKSEASLRELVYALKFRDHLQIDVIPLDLAVMQSVFRFANIMTQKYPYVSHLICNAGLASYTGVNMWLFMKQFLKSPTDATTLPEYSGQTVGEISVNGLGWIWQCNVFAHYCLFRSLEPLLAASPSGPRTIWMSSLTALARYYDPGDWQLIKSTNAYEASKYQLELLVTQLERVSVACHNPEMPPRITHIIVDPGITNTKFSEKLRNCFTTIIQIFLFYIVRLIGSAHHTITPYKAAVSAVQLALVPLYFLSAFKILEIDQPERKENLTEPTPNEPDFRPRRYCSVTDWSGREEVRMSGISKWRENEGVAEQLLDRLEGLYEYWMAEASTQASK